MRPHPQIPPYIVRPTRDTAVLVIQLAPVNGDPVPSLRIALDRRSGPRLLRELIEAACDIWIVDPCDNTSKSEAYRTVATANILKSNVDT